MKIKEIQRCRINGTFYYVITKVNGGIYLQRRETIGTSDSPLSSYEELIVSLCDEITKGDIG